MEKDKKRFNRSRNQTSLSLGDAQVVLSDICDGEIDRLEYLEGGFSNSNYMVRFKNEIEPVVIRIGDLTSKQFEIETSISRIFDNIKAPLLLKTTQLREMNLAVYKYYGGTLLSRTLDNNEYSLKLAFDVGKSLAAIHKVKFDNPGFFNEKLEVETVTSNFGEELIDFTIGNLKKPFAVLKMGTVLNKEAINLIEKNRERLTHLEDTCALVHFDFNPKNIIARNDEVEVILDWEYAASGCPLVDIANFFRFEEDYSFDFLTSFITGYEESAGKLPADWRRVIRLLDLASMSNFITRSKDLDNSSKTAINIVKQTVEFMK